MTPSEAQREGVPASGGSNVKTRVLLALKFVASFVLMWVILRHLDFDQLRRQIAAASALPLIGAVALCAASLWVVTLRWQIILRHAGHEVRYLRLVNHVFVGYFLSQAMPSTVGDGVRAWLVYRDGVPLAPAIRSVFIERLVGLGVLVLLAAAGFPWLLREAAGNVNIWLIEGGIAVMFVIGVVVLWAMQRSVWLGRFRVGRELVGLAADLWSLLRHPGALVLVCLVSLIVQVAGCALIWLAALSVGADIPFVQTLIVMPGVMVLIGLPISIAGWGVREGAVVFGLGLFGVSATDAVLVSVLFGLVTLVVGLIGGAVWLIQRDRIALHPSSVGVDATVEEAAPAPPPSQKSAT
ncbi:MAG: rane protein [Xanthobacteraceae bacterium]|nr:rane protein [Xanthobacteraceae bacterium]